VAIPIFFVVGLSGRRSKEGASRSCLLLVKFFTPLIPLSLTLCSDPHVMIAVALLFMRDQKTAKARKWFNRAVTLDPDLGDAWIAYYKFEVDHGTEDQADAVVKQCIKADPRHGEKW
jgi:hypothetical protein